MRMRIVVPLIMLLVLVSGDMANARGVWWDGCYRQFKNLFEGPSSKKEWISAPAKSQFDLSSPSGKTRMVDLVDKGAEAQVVSSAPMNRLLSDPSTPMGKIARKLNEQGTAVVLYPRRFGPKGAFVDFRVKGDVANQSGVIILNPKARGLTDARALLGHEAYHARMQAKRARGEKDLFNSQFHSKTESGGLYDQYVSSEEIHAWSKEFIQVAVKSDHSKTVKLIRDRMHSLPGHLAESEKLNLIRIKSDSVISPSYQKFIGEYQLVLEAHQAFVGRMRQALETGQFKLKFSDQQRVILETEELVFQADNFSKLPNGSADLFAIRKELADLHRINNQLSQKVETVSAIMQRASREGSMTASEYILLKNELSRFGGLVSGPSKK